MNYYCGHSMPRANSLEKTLTLGKIERKNENGPAKDEMAREHHWLNGHGFEQIPGDSGGLRSLVCCNPLGHKESGMT